MQVPRLREHLLAAGFEPTGNAPEHFEKEFHADIKRYAELVRAAKIAPQ